MRAPHREGTVKEAVETAKNHGLLTAIWQVWLGSGRGAGFLLADSLDLVTVILREVFLLISGVVKLIH